MLLKPSVLDEEVPGRWIRNQLGGITSALRTSFL